MTDLPMDKFKDEFKSINSIRNQEQREAKLMLFFDKLYIALEVQAEIEALRSKLMSLSPENDMNARIIMLEDYVTNAVKKNGMSWLETLELLAENAISDAQFCAGMNFLALDGLAKHKIQDCDDDCIELKGLQWIWTAAASGLPVAVDMKQRLVDGEQYNQALFAELESFAKLNRERCNLAAILNREWLAKMKVVKDRMDKKTEK